ncbi:transcription termination factor Rho [Corynebacterium mastitidis]|uniref:transcription termination factor Rho n=1 Tax=Corynebacterium mastitidis TaxID=161890 RepID=UPI0030E7C002
MTTPENAAQGGGSEQNLATLRIPELRAMAAQMGLKGISGLRKSDLIDAIQGRGPRAARRSAPEKTSVKESEALVDHTAQGDSHNDQAAGNDAARARTRDAGESGARSEAAEGRTESTERSERPDRADRPENREEHGSDNGHYESRSAARRARRNRARQQHRGEDSAERREEGGRGENNRSGGDSDGDHRDSREQRGGRGQRRNNRRNNRRGRNNGTNGTNGNDGGREHSEQLLPEELEQVAGILDMVDNNVAFLRTTGYHPSSADVYVSGQLIRKCGLRGGDAIVGHVKQGQTQTRGHGRNKQKYNNLVRVDTVNGMAVEEARQRPHFAKLTPLYPNQRLRLETEQKILTTRVIDLIMPIGKGQRALIVSPPKAGKTTILQNVANAISVNNPECYLMVVLVDERPEEVTDMQRSVNGEVIASTFDRPPSEHTAVAELAIERAKRLVEQGRDVVVLLDSITRLGRAYNNSSPASGRILSGGVDSNALYPPKRFLGAARNIENGGSLTIIATAMVETGSAGDTVIFEEFKGTGNAELKLDRKISERRVFPAVDVGPSGTRKDELLLAPEEARLVHKLRRILAALDNQQAIDLLIKQLKKTKNNGEFLMQVASSAPMAARDDEEDYS